jgi:MurNAc alpha-1-phosphate uridylyltransferase
MRALILAAGRGERMRPLTDTVAKPLLEAGGRRLIEWQIAGLVRAGITELVINTAHLAEQVESTLGDGARYGARIEYSREGPRAQDALETRGGIVQALPLLGDEPFAVVSGDILTNYDYRSLAAPARRIARGELDGHFVLVDNPPYHPGGDMGMDHESGLVVRSPPLLTYANIVVLAPRIFAGVPPVRTRLFPWLYRWVEEQRVSAEHWTGMWSNVGTPQDLAAAAALLG